MKPFAIVAAAALGAAFFVPATASAQETVLRFATTNAPMIPINAKFLHPWAKRVNEQGKGVLQVDVRDGPTIANHLNYYERVMNDVVQIAWGLQVYLGGRFPLCNVVSLPFVADKSEHSSTALYRLYKSGALGAEYDQAIPLLLVGFPQSQVHFRSTLRAYEDLKGLKMVAGSKMQADNMTALGAAPVTLPITDIYDAVNRGTADGMVTPWTAFRPFKFAEVTKFHIDAPMGGGPGHVVISKAKYAALPEAARKILAANAEEKDTRAFGRFWDGEQELGRNDVKGMQGHTIVTLTADQQAKWQRQLDTVAENWVKATPGGAQIFERYKALLAEVKAGG